MADCIFGVDLGLSGGVAMVPLSDGEPRVWRMPTLAAPKGKGRVYDLPGIVDRLHAWAPDHVFIEAAQLRGQATASKQVAVSVARCQALFEMMCCVRGYPCTIVSAHTWQVVMFAGLGKVEDTKAASIVAAKRLFPDVNLRPGECKKDQDGLSDSLLLAEYGRRQLYQSHATGRDPDRPPGHHRSPGAAYGHRVLERGTNG